MKYLSKFILCFLLFLCHFSVFGQQKYYPKAEQHFEKKNYERALKYLEKSKKDKTISNDPETYLLESKIWLGINTTEHIPDAPKNAVKAAVKAILKADKNFVKDNAEHFALISEINNTEAMANFNNERYSKAIPLFKRGLDLNADSFISFMLAKSYMKNNDPRLGMVILEEVIMGQFKNYLNKNPYGDFTREAFDMYTNSLIAKGLTDSTELFLSMGLSMFPSDRSMLDKQRVIWYQRADEYPLSYDLYDFLNTTTQTYPYDSFFTFKKNGVYLTFIKNNIKSNHLTTADSWLNLMKKEKVQLASKSPNAEQLRQDFFLQKDSSIFIERMVFYFGNYGQTKAQGHLFGKLAKMRFDESPEGYLKTIEALKPIFPAKIIANNYMYAIGKTKTSLLKNSMLAWYKTLLNQKVKNGSDYEALLSINSLVAKTDKAKQWQKDREQILLNHWQFSLQTKDLWKAYELGRQFEKEFSSNDSLKTMWHKTIEVDFDEGYFDTRVLLQTPGDKTNGFTWNGTTSGCKPGYLPDSILGKITRRINYFRRLAGIENPIGLSKSYNEACQEAVLFYAANKNLTHELNPALSCYTYNAAEAGRYSLLSQGMHTSIAITEFMNDNSISVGNRRWMLYPPTKAMGFGCTNFQNALWCVNENASWDTNYYKTNFMSWPPAGYSPKMFAFKNWSFSGYYNFEGATVKMTDIKNNAEIACEVYAQVVGYGMPSLVWAPKTIYKSVTEDADINIEIKLKSGKVFSYFVHLVDYKK